MSDQQAANTDLIQQWRCHKIVRAGKITAAEVYQDGSAKLNVQTGEGKLLGLLMPAGFVRPGTHIQEGDYFVLYDDGYKSWSPAAVFEAGYHRLGEQS